MLKIVHTPNKVLTTPAKPVKEINQEVRRLIAEMKHILFSQKNPEGVGLAAPQVGALWSIFIIKPEPNSKIEVFINPKILKRETCNAKPASQKTRRVTQENAKNKEKKENSLEGCLSIPRIWSAVRRADKIHLEYQTVDAEKKTAWFKGFKAVIIQHEADHLQGILFTQRAVEQNAALFEEKDKQLVKMNF